MSGVLVIEGWRCVVRDSNTRVAKLHGTAVWLAGDGYLCAEKTYGTLGFPHRLEPVPPAVLAWLIQPMMSPPQPQPGHKRGQGEGGEGEDSDV